MAMLALIGPLGFQELLLILLALVLLFGAKRIPEIARGLGEGIRGFRTSLRGDEEPPGPEGGGDSAKSTKSIDPR